MAHRALATAEILARAAALNLRRPFFADLTPLRCRAHRKRCAAAILALPDALIFLPPGRLPTALVPPSIAASCCSSASMRSRSVTAFLNSRTDMFVDAAMMMLRISDIPIPSQAWVINKTQASSCGPSLAFGVVKGAEINFSYAQDYFSLIREIFHNLSCRSPTRTF